MQHSAALTRQRQIRGFVVAWLGITLVMGALTFAGIYYATGLVAGEQEASVAALPNADADSLVDAAPLAAPPATAGVGITPSPPSHVGNWPVERRMKYCWPTVQRFVVIQ